MKIGRATKFGVLVGLVLWLIDALLDYFLFFTELSFIEALLYPPVHEVVVRSVILVIIIISGILIDQYLQQLETTNSLLKQSEREKLMILDNIGELILFFKSPELTLDWYNNPAQQLFLKNEYSPSGRCFGEITGNVHKTDCPVKLSLTTGEDFSKEITADDNSIWQTRTTTLKERGEIIGVMQICRDITEELSLQKQLVRSQKLEVIGRFTGGIAHDFNNLLTVINGYIEMLRDSGDLQAQSREFVHRIAQAGKSASNLTKKLLMFGRKHVSQREVINVNEQIRELYDLMERIIAENIEISLLLDPDKQDIYIDPSEFETILMNLIVNAKDAMPQGGVLNIETNRVYLSQEKKDLLEMKSKVGEYILISISDTGYGISRESMEHVFEPFFTTKPLGEGSGLGLTTVYGLVRKHNGHISIYSEEGEGTTVKLYFPVASRPENITIELNDISEEILAENEVRVIIVEDDVELSRLFSIGMENVGITISSFNDPLDALEELSANNINPDIIVSDLIMPSMNGVEFEREVLDLGLKIPFIFISGYSNNLIAKKGILKEGVDFLQKPLTISELVRKIAEVYKKRVL